MKADPESGAPHTLTVPFVGPAPEPSDPVIKGMKAIAELLGTSVRSVERWARRARDPLPLFRRWGSIIGRKSAIEAWKERQRERVTSDDVGSGRVVAARTAIVRRKKT